MTGIADFTGATFDSRSVRPGMAFVALKGEKVDGHDFIDQARAAGAVRIIDGLEELREVAVRRRRALKAKVIGVTGSAGKTTTKELLRSFLSVAGKVHATAGNFNNHIGLPITILNCPVDADYLVVEMGTNHPGEIAALCDVALPDVGLITNIGTAHIEFFRTQDGIAEEKGTLFARLPPDGFAVASRENSRLGILRRLCAQAAFFAVDQAQPWMAAAMAEVLPGAHNVANACLAYAVAERFGVTRERAVAALSGFALPGARWRRIVMKGVVFIDDTYNANPDSMIAALDALASLPGEGRKVAVLGDMFELGPESEALHRRVFSHARKSGLGLLVGVGEMCSRCDCDLAFPSAEALRQRLPQLVRSGDTVLLKASHGMNLGSLLAIA